MWHLSHIAGNTGNVGTYGWPMIPTLKQLPPEEQVNCKPPYGAGLMARLEVNVAVLDDGNHKLQSEYYCPI